MDDLQFEKAEFSNPAGVGPCVVCGARIHASYYTVNGQAACPNCGVNLSKSQEAPQKSVLLRGILYALGAAVACSIAYAAILTITNYELALISIAVGWLIGTAVRKGTNGLGGRPMQIIAVVATYVAICGSWFFQAVWDLYQSGREPVSNSGYVIMLRISMAKPYLEMRGDGLSGILGIAILFFGLQQAWQQTGNAQLSIAGPFSTAVAKQES
ncbi:hypothetical protein [Bryobacter aggregatus]|uniref:hypothetical protein n=1 Tax=Bryobacter aggregatus TaxID=360054 RepID=UPI0004E1E6B3|nr:hypothetical protein [Bryobacter aggregatus]